MESQRDADLDALWSQVNERWDDRATHDAFLQACHARSNLGVAAARYRTAAEDPARKEVATKRLGAVSLLAMQAIESTKSEPRKKLPRWLLMVGLSMTISAVGWFLYVVFK